MLGDVRRMGKGGEGGTISAQPRAASMPIPRGPEAPVTTTTFPLREKRSMRDSALGTVIGILMFVWIGVGSVFLERQEVWVDGIRFGELREWERKGWQGFM